MSGLDRETEERANELYWSSDLGVNRIADEMDLSKGMLYELIRPEAAGLACPQCSEELVYANRTARDRAVVACPRCGWDGEEDEADVQGGEGSVVLPTEAVSAEAASEPAPASGGSTRSRVMLGGALLGAAAGLAMVLWSKRR